MTQPTPDSPLYPKLTGATVLTPAELNNVRLSDAHTVLTPELLAQKQQQ